MESVEAALTAAIKYDMTPAVRYLANTLVEGAKFISYSGEVAYRTLLLNAFIIACKHGRKGEARVGAHATLCVPLVSVFIPELRDITAAQ